MGGLIFYLRGSRNRRIEAATVPFTISGICGKFPFITLAECGIFFVEEGVETKLLMAAFLGPLRYKTSHPPPLLSVGVLV